MKTTASKNVRPTMKGMLFIQNKLCNPAAIEISKLHPFENHPYQVLDNEEMETLTESIQANVFSNQMNSPATGFGFYSIP